MTAAAAVAVWAVLCGLLVHVLFVRAAAADAATRDRLRRHRRTADLSASSTPGGMPPGVDLSDVYTVAAAYGVSTREAARALYLLTAQVRVSAALSPHPFNRPDRP